MDRTCLNPECDTVMPVIGVCVACANGAHKPERDGLDLGEDA